MDFEWKRSGQIPAFGNWDNANELPITQYFESARLAGLVRYASAALATADQCDLYMTNARGSGGHYPNIDLYAVDFQKPSARVVAVPPRKQQKQKQQQQRIKQVQVKVYDVVDLKQQLPLPIPPPTRSQQLFYNNTNNQKQRQQFPKPYSANIADYHHPILTHNRPSTSTTITTTTTSVGASASTASSANVKPVDEDLYKIPPELLLHNSKLKKMLGFFSKCLVPPCKA